MANETEGLVIGGTILGIVALAGYMFFSPKGPVDDPNIPPISRDTQNFLEAYLPFLNEEEKNLGPGVDRHVGSFSKGGKSKKNKSKKSKKRRISRKSKK